MNLYEYHKLTRENGGGGSPVGVPSLTPKPAEEDTSRKNPPPLTPKQREGKRKRRKILQQPPEP